MELDYERCKYPIPDHLAIHILDYISATQHAYQSNIDVLFCKHSQFAGAKVIIENDKHYTYANLRQWLCENGHSFQAPIREMALRWRCPHCERKRTKR